MRLDGKAAEAGLVEPIALEMPADSAALEFVDVVVKGKW